MGACLAESQGVFIRYHPRTIASAGKVRFVSDMVMSGIEISLEVERTMVQVPSLVLYGNSVFLAGIKTELERRLVLHLVTVEAGSPGAAGVIRALRPCAVIFDLAVGQPEFTVALLRELPGLLLMGMDPSSDEMVVVSSFPAQAMTIDDLLDIINRTDFSSQQYERRQDQEDCCAGELVYQKDTDSEAIKEKEFQGSHGNNTPSNPEETDSP